MPAPYGLTDRELAVLRLLAAGQTNTQIGAELHISPTTARVHVSNILRKLGVTSRVQAAALAERVRSLRPALNASGTNLNTCRPDPARSYDPRRAASNASWTVTFMAAIMPGELVMVMIVLGAIGGAVGLLVLVDMTDSLLVRAGKRSIFRRRTISTGDVIGPSSAAGGTAQLGTLRISPDKSPLRGRSGGDCAEPRAQGFTAIADAPHYHLQADRLPCTATDINLDRRRAKATARARAAAGAKRIRSGRRPGP